MLEELKEEFSNSEVMNAKAIDQHWVGVAVKFLFTLVVFTERKGKITVRIMDLEYPFEPDIYTFKDLHEAVLFVKTKVGSLASASKT